MNRVSQAGVGVVLLLSAILASDSGLRAQARRLAATDVERARQRLEGTFELVEWTAGGKVLTPPQVEGRFSIHDGVILFMTRRNDLPTPETVSGYGSYTIDRTGWTYGYSYLETIRGESGASLTRTVRPPSSTLLELRWQGDTLVVIGQGSDHREYGPETFTSRIGSAGDYRKWRRMR